MNAIEIRAVSKRFGDTPVLHELDLNVTPGEFLVLVGPSGCGKSTLLRLIAGLEEVSSGEILIGGKRVNDLPPRSRDIAMVFQSYALYPHMSVADNMAYSLRLRGMPRPQIAAAVQAAAAKLGLQSLLTRKPKALSGGQRQRVAMGRAIVRKPGAFLFDEPLSNLDARLREHMRAEIKKLHREIGATSIYVTHDQIEAMTLADRIVALDGGHVQQVGSPLELYDRPANLFVAGFIGSPAMNMFPAQLRRASDHWSLQHEQFVLSLGAQADQPGLNEHEDAALTVGIRPEHVAVGSGPIRALVELIEPTGIGTLVHVRLGSVVLKAFSLERLPLTVGAPVAIDLPAARLHLFDAAGKRVAA
jgi:multiple sugar transport system ATP-binding protein